MNIFQLCLLGSLVTHIFILDVTLNTGFWWADLYPSAAMCMVSSSSAPFPQQAAECLLNTENYFKRVMK